MSLWSHSSSLALLSFITLPGLSIRDCKSGLQLFSDRNSWNYFKGGSRWWKQKLDEHHPTKTEKLVRSCVENWIRLHTVLEGRMEGTRTRGRQNATMIDWMKSNDVEYQYIKKRAYDREDWRHWRPEKAEHKKKKTRWLAMAQCNSPYITSLMVCR